MSTRKLSIAVMASALAPNSSRLAEAPAHALLRHLPAESKSAGRLASFGAVGERSPGQRRRVAMKLSLLDRAKPETPFKEESA